MHRCIRSFFVVENDAVECADKAEALYEIAQFEERANQYSRALKHYRMILRLGVERIFLKANE